MSATPDTPTFPTLHTTRLVLREITHDDAPALLSVHGDAEAMRWYGTDPLTRPEQAQALVRVFAGWRQLANPGTRWGLARIDAPHPLLGSCGLFSWNRAWRKCTVGYELAAPAQGQGLMREALCAVLDYGFAHMDLNRVEAQIHPANTASLRLARALGFAEEGVLREVAFWGGRHHDLLQLALLRRHWPPAP